MAIRTRKSGDLVYLIDENIPVPHAFTTRLGGVSEGSYHSLNPHPHVGDDPAAVSENVERILAVLGGDKAQVVFSRQIHTDHIRVVGASDCLTDIHHPLTQEADGLITIEPDVTLAVFTADCIPILLWDAYTGAVAALHAGWRSTVLDIAGKAVEKLCAMASYPKYIRASIGPGIGMCCFETDSDVPEAMFETLGADVVECIKDLGSGKSRVDLKEVNRRLLLGARLLPEHITVSDYCTMCNPDLFWSHRVTGDKRGAQAAIIRRGEAY